MAEISRIMIGVISDTRGFEDIDKASKSTNKTVQSTFQVTEEQLDQINESLENIQKNKDRLETIQSIEFGIDLILLFNKKRVDVAAPGLITQIARQFVNLPESIPATVRIEFIKAEISDLNFERTGIKLGLATLDLTDEQERAALERIENIDRRVAELQQEWAEAFQTILGPPDELDTIQNEITRIQNILSSVQGEDLQIELLPEEQTVIQRAQNILARVKEQLMGANVEEFNLLPADEESLREAQAIIDRVKQRLQEQGQELENVTKRQEDFTEAVGDTNTDTGRLTKQVAQATEQVTDLNDESSKIDIKDKLSDVPQEIIKPEAIEPIKEIGPAVTKSTDEATNSLTSLGVFAGNIATNIAESFSDFISTAFKGEFNDIEDLWDGLLDSLQDAFADFIAGLLAKPLLDAFEKTINGEDGGIFDLIGGLFDFGGGSGGEQSTTPPKIPAPGTEPFNNQELPEVDSSIISTLGSIVGTVGKVAGIVGTIIAVVTSLVNVIKGLFEKTPRLDLDFDQFRDADGVSIGIAATVADLFDSDTFLNEIFNTSVSRQAGLGLGGGAGKVIQEALATQIEEIQDIINTLPFELAAQLNEALLSTPVDIESEVKGDRLLEFNETKDIAKKFDDFINGDLQARFLFSIRDFFVGAFESLGVLGSAAQNFIDAEFEAFQGLNREQRAEAGKELLQDFQTLTDAFNVINNNGPDSIGATVNSIKNLSNSLGFDAVPSIEELDAGIEDLINAAELDPDIIQDYLDLRNAILEAQRAILGSIQSIISSISSLNSIITGAGGSAFDLGGFINDGINNVIGLLGQDGLSIEDQEELLGLGEGFLDQLIAEEQAAFQAQLEAAQEAAEAAAEAQRNAIRAQIDGLEAERDLINENFDARLEALQEELRLAEEFARLTESIQQTLDSIILGPDSVFTAVERLNIVQGNIANLQSELAATTDPERQLELAGQLEDSLSTLFDLAGEAFGVNSPEFTAIFEQVTGGLNDLLDLTGNRTRSVEEINAEIEALNIERNQQLEAIDAQISNLNDQLSSIQAENVDATFQVSDQVLEYAEFFRGEYVRLLEERFAQLGEVSETGFATEIEGLEKLAEGQFEQIEIEAEMLIALRDISSALAGAPQFMDGSGGFRNFGSGTLAFLHGNEAVVTQDTFVGFINDIASSFRGSLESNVAENFGSAIGDLNRFRLPLRFDEFENFFTTRAGSVGQTESGGDMNVNINVNVDGGSAAAVDTIATSLEDMLVRSIRQGGKLRSAVQEAGAKRLN